MPSSACSAYLPMEHNPLGYGDYAVLGLAQRRELGENGVVGVGHGDGVVWGCYAVLV